MYKIDYDFSRREAKRSIKYNFDNFTNIDFLIFCRLLFGSNLVKMVGRTSYGGVYYIRTVNNKYEYYSTYNYVDNADMPNFNLGESDEFNILYNVINGFRSVNFEIFNDNFIIVHDRTAKYYYIRVCLKKTKHDTFGSTLFTITKDSETYNVFIYGNYTNYMCDNFDDIIDLINDLQNAKIT